jgi:hypothetical protein
MIRAEIGILKIVEDASKHCFARADGFFRLHAKGDIAEGAD